MVSIFIQLRTSIQQLRELDRKMMDRAKEDAEKHLAAILDLIRDMKEQQKKSHTDTPLSTRAA